MRNEMHPLPRSADLDRNSSRTGNPSGSNSAGTIGTISSTFLDNLDIKGEVPGRVSAVSARSFDWLRILFGLIILYDAWTSLSWDHKMQMMQFLGVSMESPWLHPVVAAISFVKIAIAVSLLAGRGVKVMGWVGVVYALLVWLIVEHGGEFDQDATDPGIGLPYLVAFLFVIGADRVRGDPDVGHNQMLALARISFGLLWAYDALLKFQPYFLANYLDYLTEAGKDATGWQATYVAAWVALSSALGPKLIAWLVALTEAGLAAGLLLGRGLRILGPIGLVLSFVIWSVPEQWGGPYSLGVTGTPMSLVGIAVIYMVALGYVWVLYNPLDLFKGRSAVTAHDAPPLVATSAATAKSTPGKPAEGADTKAPAAVRS